MGEFETVFFAAVTLVSRQFFVNIHPLHPYLLPLAKYLLQGISVQFCKNSAVCRQQTVCSMPRQCPG